MSEGEAEKVLTAMSFDGLCLQMGANGLTDLLKKDETEEAREAKRKVFQTDVSNLRKRIASRQTFINPRASRIQYWDLCTAIALCFTAIVTPYEVCVGLETKFDTLYVINSIMNLIFMIDIFVQFFLPVLDPKTKELIRDHRILARKYFRGWFAIDLFTVLPFDTLTMVAPDLFGADCGSGNATLIKGIKLIRILRLFKLLRMLRASRIVQRWDNAISVSTSSRTMIFAWTTWSICMHWLACIWLLLPQLQDSYRDDPRLSVAITARLARNDSTSFGCEACLCSSDPDSYVCRNPCLTPCEVEEMAGILGWQDVSVRESQPWLCRALTKGWLDPDFIYQPGLMWAFGLAKVLGGLGPLGAVNAAESMLVSLVGLAVRISFAVLQGLILRVLTTGDPDETKFRQRLDALNYMMKDQHVPNEMRLKVRSYVRKTKQIVKRAGYFSLIDTALSRQLRKEMRGVLSAGIFQPVWWLQGCEPIFLQELSNFTSREAYAEGEMIPHVMRKVGKNGQEYDEWRLCLLVSGVANRAGSIITSGSYWGDVILTNPMLRDSRAATSMGFCEIASLARAGLDETLAKYPKSAAIIRQAALKLATKRAVMISAMFAQLHGQGVPALSGIPGEPNSPSKTLKALHDHNLLGGPSNPWREPDQAVPPASSPPYGAKVSIVTPTKAPPPAISLPPPVTPPEGRKGMPERRQSTASGTPTGTQAFAHLVEKLGTIEATNAKLEAQMNQVLSILSDGFVPAARAQKGGWGNPLAA